MGIAGLRVIYKINNFKRQGMIQTLELRQKETILSRTFTLRYWLPVALCSKNHLVNCANLVIPNFNRLKGSAREMALIDTYKDLLRHNTRKVKGLTKISTITNFVMVKTIVKLMAYRIVNPIGWPILAQFVFIFTTVSIIFLAVEIVDSATGLIMLKILIFIHKGGHQK